MTEEERRHVQQLEDKIYCLEDIIEHVSEGIILTDESCRIIEFNSAKEQMEHLKASDVMGMVSWEAYTHSNREVSEHRRVFDSGVPILNAYRPHAYVNDVPVYIYYSTYPVIRDGKILGVYTISRNEEIVRELLHETIESKRGTALMEPPGVSVPRMAPGTRFTFSNFAGKSAQTKELIHEAQMVASTDSSVLILGETGTGKEVLAQSIHNFWREEEKFVSINCAAIPDNLLESTLFGSVRGAFTGAMDRQGLFAAAGNGTLFLDEINSMSVTMQAKLLRALQEKCIRPVGSLKEEPIHCRLICSSNEKAEALLNEGRMRQDLFYRISDFILTIPPLRERKEDIWDLTEMFIRRYREKFNKNVMTISPELRAKLLQNPWSGNTRELEHVIQNLMLRVPELETELKSIYYPSYFQVKGPAEEHGAMAETQERISLQDSLQQIQRELICAALKRNNGNVTKAAQELGLQRQNLAQRMKRLSITSES